LTAFGGVPSVERVSGEPEWIEPTIQVTPGRDPIGIQTITIDRIMPVLAPGILALSRRARYLSFHSFLLDEFERRRMTPTMAALSEFIKAREYEYALAVQLCPNGCGDVGSGVVGKQRAAPTIRTHPEDQPYPRGESVESHLGGYGLYYRTPLTELKVVAPSGTQYRRYSDGDVTVVDVLVDKRADSMAAAFREAVAETTYYREYMFSDEPIPRDVLTKYSTRACLCRLVDAPTEQERIRSALFDVHPLVPEAETIQRRRSIALFLWLVGKESSITDSDAAFRSVIWSTFVQLPDNSGVLAEAVTQWAALVAKEYLQEGLSSVWSHVCRSGLQQQPSDGFSHSDFRSFLRNTFVPHSEAILPGNEVLVDRDMTLQTLRTAVVAGAEHIPLRNSESGQRQRTPRWQDSH
jgi:hypothetical protein